MPETFLILLCAGIMLALAISDPDAVTLQWLRLGGIIALSMAGLSLYFFLRRDLVDRIALGFHITTMVLILGQLAYDQMAWRKTQRAFALGAAIIGIVCGLLLLKPQSPLLGMLSCIGIASMTGICLMDMLLGHAYLTASKMGIAPFVRLNLALAWATVLRALVAVGGVIVIQAMWPKEMLWGVFGLYIGTRWLVGLIVPGIFIYMAHDCVKRRSTQSATGILYVAGVLVFIGELIGLYLVTETGLPF